MVFDIYFLNGEDVRDNVLMRSTEEKGDDKVEKSRLEHLDDFMTILNSVSGGEGESEGSEREGRRPPLWNLLLRKRSFTLEIMIHLVKKLSVLYLDLILNLKVNVIVKR